MPKRKPTAAPTDSALANRKPRPQTSPKQAPRSATAALNKRCAQRVARNPAITPKTAPIVDLAQIAGVIPAENLQQVATAVQSGRWLLAVWHVTDGRLHLERTAANFPTVDLDKSVAMLAENLKELSNPISQTVPEGG